MYNKRIRNSNGSIDTVMITSDDNYTVRIGPNYKIANYGCTKNRFKDSIIGSDIGIHSKGFISVAIVSTLLSLGILLALYISFRI